MQIKNMSEEHFNEIIKIDEATFNRSEPRSISNLEALRISDPDVCFVLIDNTELLATTTLKPWETKVF